MLKEQIWQCDVCGRTEGSDGFPRHWIQIDIRKGDYYHADDDEDDSLLDKDCCSDICLKEMLHEFIGGRNKILPN